MNQNVNFTKYFILCSKNVKDKFFFTNVFTFGPLNIYFTFPRNSQSFEKRILKICFCDFCDTNKKIKKKNENFTQM